jgi:hypothetical protein
MEPNFIRWQRYSTILLGQLSNASRSHEREISVEKKQSSSLEPRTTQKCWWLLGRSGRCPKVEFSVLRLASYPRSAFGISPESSRL